MSPSRLRSHLSFTSAGSVFGLKTAGADVDVVPDTDVEDEMVNVADDIAVAMAFARAVVSNGFIAPDTAFAISTAVGGDGGGGAGRNGDPENLDQSRCLSHQVKL